MAVKLRTNLRKYYFMQSMGFTAPRDFLSEIVSWVIGFWKDLDNYVTISIYNYAKIIKCNETSCFLI